jgi:hypothetical protein
MFSSYKKAGQSSATTLMDPSKILAWKALVWLNKRTAREMFDGDTYLGSASYSLNSLWGHRRRDVMGWLNPRSDFDFSFVIGGMQASCLGLKGMYRTAFIFNPPVSSERVPLAASVIWPRLLISIYLRKQYDIAYTVSMILSSASGSVPKLTIWSRNPGTRSKKLSYTFARYSRSLRVLVYKWRRTIKALSCWEVHRMFMTLTIASWKSVRPPDHHRGCWFPTFQPRTCLWRWETDWKPSASSVLLVDRVEQHQPCTE